MVIVQLTVFKVESVSKLFFFFHLREQQKVNTTSFGRIKKGFFSGVPSVKNKLVTLF